MVGFWGCEVVGFWGLKVARLWGLRLSGLVGLWGLGVRGWQGCGVWGFKGGGAVGCPPAGGIFGPGFAAPALSVMERAGEDSGSSSGAPGSKAQGAISEGLPSDGDRGQR